MSTTILRIGAVVAVAGVAGWPAPAGDDAKGKQKWYRIENPVHQPGFVGPDGNTLVISGRSSWMQVFPPNGKQEKVRNHNLQVYFLAVSPDGKRFATCGEDTTVVIWDAHKVEELFTIKKHVKEVWRVAFSPDSRYLVTAAPGDSLYIWDLETRKEVAGLIGNGAQRVAWSPDGKNIAFATEDSVSFWEADEPRRILPTAKAHGKPIRNMAFAADGKTLITFSPENRQVVHWNARTGKVKEERTLDGVGGLHCMELSPDGKTLAFGGDAGTVHFYEVGGQKPVRTLKQTEENRYSVKNLAFRRDGLRIAAGSHDSYGVNVWELGEGGGTRLIGK